MSVRNLLKTKLRQDVITAEAQEPVQVALCRLAEKRIGALPVVGADDAVQGLLSERGLVQALAKHGPAVLEQPVEAVMDAPAVSCDYATSVPAVMGLMTNRYLRHLVVLEDNRLAGIISIGDVLKQRLTELETESSVLRDYITVTRTWH
jgi:CBS domain-containing protein